jgi:hypothetical protein
MLREADQLLSGLANVVNCLDTSRGHPPPCLVEHIADHGADAVAYQRLQLPGAIQPGMALLDVSPVARDERLLEQRIELKDPRPQPIVDVVIVVSDIVGDRRHLGLETGP